MFPGFLVQSACGFSFRCAEYPPPLACGWAPCSLDCPFGRLFPGVQVRKFPSVQLSAAREVPWRLRSVGERWAHRFLDAPLGPLGALFSGFSARAALVEGVELVWGRD